MTGKDASESRSFWKRWVPICVAGATVVAVAAAGQLIWRPGQSNAQGPQRRQVAAPQPTTRTATRTQAPSRESAPVVNAPRTQGPARAPQPQGVMAVVNGQKISRQQLANECLVRYGKDVLESLVNKHLIWQECQRQQISITEADVEQEVNQMASKFGLSVDRWLAMLEKERDIPPSKYKRDIIWPTLALRKLAAAEIVVPDEEIQKAFETEYGAKVRARLIAVSSQEKANQVWQQAKAKPENFGDLAKQVSEDANSAAARGLIPPIRKHIGSPEIEAAVFGLKEGEISNVVKVANQYLIFKCEGHEPETYIESQNLERIRQQLHDTIRDQKLRLAAASIFEKLQQQAQVVNVYNDQRLRQQMPGVAATINGQEVSIRQLSDECITRHGKDVLDGEVNRVILSQELQRQQKSVSQASIDQEITRAAEAYGYIHQDGTPDVDGWLKSITENDKVTVDLYVRDAVWPSVALKALVGDKVQITQEDLDKGFQANYGERVEVLAIVVGNQRQANTVWEMARNNPTDQFFGELAKQYSVEPVSRANFGKVPPIRRFGGQPVVEEEAFQLSVGELSGVIAIGDKYIIMRCLGRTKPVVSDFNAVKDELARDIHEKKLRLAMAEEFDRLSDNAQIDNFLAGKSQTGKKTRARISQNPR